MKRFGLGGSLTRTFAVLSLGTIGVITIVQLTVQWRLLREDRLNWERANTGREIRADAHALLRSEDFSERTTPAARERCDRFLRHVQTNPEVVRVKVYDRDMRVVCSDEPRLLGARFPDNAYLKEALGGRTVAHLEAASKPENLYERAFREAVEMYVPLAFVESRTSGGERVAGVVEIYKDPGRMLANLPRDRLIIVLTSLAGAFLLYLSLFGLVLRASRQLRSQRQGLDRQAAELGAARRDLTRLEEQLRTSERLAAVGEVSAGVAHGIRNPLANIRASAQLAQVLRDDPDSVDKQLVTITTEVDRLSRWLASLLDVARPFQPRFSAVDVNAMVEDLLPLFAERCAAASIRVERVLAPALPPLTGDRAFLEQALSSVIENSLDALHASGTLTVKTAIDTLDGRPAVSVVVSDDGEGIPEAARAQIFQPFFTTKTRGTGLGLAVTRKVVEAHGGRVNLASTPGVGTQVRIVLPVGGPPPPGHA